MNYCCDGCFNNRSIITFIREKGEFQPQCEYCGNTNVKAVSHLVLRNHLINCINKAYEYCGDSYSNEYKYTLREILVEKEDVFSDVVDSEVLITDLFTECIEFKDRLEDYYTDVDSEVFCVKDNTTGLENMSVYQAWESFKYEVMHFNRYFNVVDDEARESYLWQLLKYVKDIEIPIGNVFYRTRIFSVLPDNNAVDIYSELGPPPCELSTTNRMSPSGIPYLYLSDNKETSFKECSDVPVNALIAQFTVRKDLKIADFSDSWRAEKASIFAPDYNHDDYWIKDFISRFVSEISKPVEQSEKERSYKYVLTQMVAEYIRMRGYDGICYSSSKDKGKNYVFFYGPKAEVISQPESSLKTRILPCFKDIFDITDIERREIESPKLKLGDWVFYRSYGEYTVVYNTKDKEISFYNSTVKYILDEFSKTEFIHINNAIDSLFEKFDFEGSDSNSRYRIQSFILGLVDNKILLTTNTLIDNPNTLEVQYKKTILSDNQLVSVQLEVSFRCQERCRYCYCVTDKPEKEELTTDEIKKLIDELVEMNALDITFTGGDPFVRSDIRELLQYAYDKGLIISIYTNGMAISDSDILFLKSLYIREINFTIFSHIPEKHDYFTQVKGSFDKTVKTIRKCILIGLPVNIKTPAMNFNKDDIEEVIKMSETLGASIQVGLSISPKNDGDSEPTKYRLDSINDYVDIMKRLNDHFVYKCSEDIFEKRLIDPDRICSTGTRSVNINPYGDVFPCNPLLIKCGSIRENSLKEIWENSDELKRIRNFSFTDVEGCQTCDKQRWCTFCPGTALSEVGNPLMRYEEACMITEADTIMGKGGNPDEKDNRNA